MGLRSRLGDTLVRVGKTFGTSVPESFRQGEEAAQMTPASPFSPGTPIGPYDGYDRNPRSLNFTTGYNIATRPRLHEAVSFSTLQGLIGAYDIADICIWHRIDSIRSLKWKLLPADHYNGDVTDAIPLGLAALRKPDRKSFFKTWLAKYLYDILAYDAGALYRMRNRGGRAIGLKVVDGTTIAPLLDYWGDPPDAPAESHVQYVNGLPWNWLTRNDLIYEPFRPRPNSPYGHAPIESIILNANTDIRFQIYFLQRFTEGNLPAAFASSPETWSPDQIEQFQGYWDAMMFGDQSRKHQIRWMPGGSKIAWSDEKDFSDTFSLFMMRKTCSAFHVVPSDLGYTENVNRSSGESQADVQHRVGDLPLMEHVEEVVSMFLQDDLGLPLKHEFDRGEEQVDQLAQAQADQAYMDRAVVSPSEIRELRYGLVDAEPVARVFFTSRSGPIPLSSLEAVAGPVDPMTAAPEPGAPLSHQVFEEAPGVQPNPPLYGQPLAEEIYGPSAIPAGTETSSTMPVAKEGEGAGITSGTGLYSYDLEGRDEDEEPDEAALVAKELAAFRRFERARRKNGEWRDFEFRAVESVCGHNLNDAGRLSVRKAAGEVAVAGLAVLAADTGRVLMLQRALCDDDPAAGTWEMPGGHVEEGETPLQGAWREWAEETGCVPPPGIQTGSWTSPDGVYQGIVWTVDTEASVPVRCDTEISNPDDPDGDQAEAIAWWNPSDLPGNPAIRPELAADIDAVMTALGASPDDGMVSKASVGYRPADGGQCCGNCSMIRQAGDGWSCTLVEGPVDPGAVCDRWDPADEVAKAGGAAPKVPERERPGPEPIWGEIEDRRARLTRKHLKAVLAAWNALTADLDSRALVRQYRAGARQVAKYADPDRNKALEAALAWLAALYAKQGWAALVAAVEDAIRSGMTEGEAGALAVAAARQGVTGFAIDQAFTAAYERLASDGSISQRAADTAESMVSGAAGDVSGVLAGAPDDASEDDTASAVDSTVTGNDVRPVGSWLTDAIWGAIGAGVVWLCGMAGSGTMPDGTPAPPDETPQPPSGLVFIAWITDGKPCLTCIDNEANGPYAPQDVPAFPAHRYCQCNLDIADNIPASFFAAYLLD